MLAHQVPPPSRLIISMWMFVVGCVWECEWICARSNNIISLSRVSMALRFSGPWEVGQTYLRRKPGLNTTWFIHIEHGFFVGPGRTFVSIVISKPKGRIWLLYLIILFTELNIFLLHIIMFWWLNFETVVASFSEAWQVNVSVAHRIQCLQP